MGSRLTRPDNRDMSAAATLINADSAASSRLLADVSAAHGHDSDHRESALDRLAVVLGQEFADRLVAALSTHARNRLEAALSREFADHIAAALAKERRESVSRRELP